MPQRPQPRTVLVCLACAAAVMARFYASPQAFYEFFTRAYNPIRLWHPEQTDSSQFLDQLAPWLWAWLPSVGASTLVIFALLWGTRSGLSVPLQKWTSRWDGAFRYWAGAAFIVLAVIRLNYFALPIATDERAYHFQGELIRQGHLRADTPQFPDAFQSSGIYCKGFWTSSYQPGWPAVLALTGLVGLSALANCGWWLACLILVRRLAQLVWGRSEAFWASMLFATSSCFWFAAWSDFPHLQTSALGLLSWELFFRYQEPENPYRRGQALAIIACWAWVAITRLQDFPTVLAVPAVWLLVSQKSRSGQWLMVAGCLVSAGFTALANFWQTGNALQMPFSLYNGDQNPHSVWRGFFNLAFYLFRISWWMPPFFLGLPFLKRPRNFDWGLVAGLFSQVSLYFCYYSNAGGEWGARFYTIALILACLLGGAALARLRLHTIALVALAILVILENFQTVYLGYRDYASPAGPIGWQLALRSVTQAQPCLIFVRRVPQGSQADAAVDNHPDFRPPVYAIWLDPEQNEKIRQRFSGLRPLVLDFGKGLPQPQPYPEKDAFSPDAYYRAGSNYLETLHDRKQAIACFKKSLPTARPDLTYLLLGRLQRDESEAENGEAALQLREDALESFKQALKYDENAVQARAEYDKLLKGAP